MERTNQTDGVTTTQIVLVLLLPARPRGKRLRGRPLIVVDGSTKREREREMGWWLVGCRTHHHHHHHPHHHPCRKEGRKEGGRHDDAAAAAVERTGHSGAEDKLADVRKPQPGGGGGCGARPAPSPSSSSGAPTTPSFLPVTTPNLLLLLVVPIAIAIVVVVVVVMIRHNDLPAEGHAQLDHRPLLLSIATTTAIRRSDGHKVALGLQDGRSKRFLPPTARPPNVRNNAQPPTHTHTHTQQACIIRRRARCL